MTTSIPGGDWVSKLAGSTPEPCVSTEHALIVPVRRDNTVPIVLTAKSVRKSYQIGGEVRCVLDNVDFQVRSGECVFLSGPSGSGKSTLLSILGCLLEADSGRITIGEKRVDKLNVAQRTLVRRNMIGFGVSTVSTHSSFVSRR